MTCNINQIKRIWDNYKVNENLECIPGESVYLHDRYSFHSPRGHSDLFLFESIQNSNCLNDDFEFNIITADNDM